MSYSVHLEWETLDITVTVTVWEDVHTLQEELDFCRAVQCSAVQCSAVQCNAVSRLSKIAHCNSELIKAVSVGADATNYFLT